jgi:hypothetical protein
MAPNLCKATSGLLGDEVEGFKFKSSRFTLKGKDLVVDDHPFLLDVPTNICLTSVLMLIASEGCFLSSEAWFMSIFRTRRCRSGSSDGFVHQKSSPTRPNAITSVRSNMNRHHQPGEVGLG